MVDKKHTDMLSGLKVAQGSDNEARDKARESIRFIREAGGQWEDRVEKLFSGKPRYEFDRIYPVITSICGDIQDMDFSASVVEAGAGKNADVAETYNGMIRSIQSISNFSAIRSAAAKHVVTSGYDAWEVVTDWANADAFEQDILIKAIPDAINRVWVGSSDDIDRSDAQEAWKLTSISSDEYVDKYPEGARQSVGSESKIEKDDGDIVIGDYYYIASKSTELHLLSDDRVVKSEVWKQVSGEEVNQGITIVRSRKRDIDTCYVRQFDGNDWLGEAQETPFSYIPIVGVYGHYDVIEGKRLYFGVTEKLKDPQRVYNYAKSREISEGALAPIEKIVMTEEQAAGHEAQNSTLNSDSNPLLVYNPDPKAGGAPYKLAGNQPNANLAITQQGAATDIQDISSSFNPARGQGLSGHSGVAYEMLQSKSNLSIIDYVSEIALSITLTAKIIVDAIPKVYDTRGRQVRLLNEDGTSSFESVNQEVYSDDGEPTIVRDLSQGHYDVIITTGKTFSSKKTQGFDSMLTLAQAYPQMLEEGADILLKASDAPYIDQVAERIRKRMVEDGRIPEGQLTDKEREKIMEEMEAAKNQGPDPMQEAALQAVRAESERLQSEAAKNMQDMQIAMREQMRKKFETQMKAMKIQADTQKTQAETVETLIDSEGIPAAQVKAREVVQEID